MEAASEDNFMLGMYVLLIPVHIMLSPLSGPVPRRLSMDVDRCGALIYVLAPGGNALFLNSSINDYPAPYRIDITRIRRK